MNSEIMVSKLERGYGFAWTDNKLDVTYRYADKGARSVAEAWQRSRDFFMTAGYDGKELINGEFRDTYQTKED